MNGRIHIFRIVVCTLVFIALGSRVGADSSLPEGPQVNYQCAGKPLREVLTAIGAATHVTLEVSPTLERQRVTLGTTQLPLPVLATCIARLLSTGSDGSVRWTKKNEESWRLNDSLNWRQYAERQRSAESRGYAAFLADEIHWAQTEADAIIKTAEEKNDLARRIRASNRRFIALLLDAQSRESLYALFAGEPLTVKVGQLPSQLRKHGRQYFRDVSEEQARLGDAQLDEFSLVLMSAKTPGDQLGRYLVLSKVDPAGRRWSRMSLLRIPHPQVVPYARPELRFPMIDPSDRSRRVSFTLLTGTEKESPRIVWITLNQLLLRVSRETGTNIIADGYLRPAARVSSALSLNEYPSRQLFDYLSDVWGFDWTYLDETETTVLIRSRAWWDEDECDVPEETLQELNRLMPQGSLPTLVGLAKLAELSPSQCSKVIEAGLFPQASGLSAIGWYDSAGPRECLRLFGRLSSQQQALAMSESGIPLAQLSDSLLRRTLHSTLTAEVGAVTPELQRQLIFKLQPVGEKSMARGFEITFLERGTGQIMWRRSVGLPAQ